MKSVNRRWGWSIRALLKRHNLTLRGASKKCGLAVSHMTIMEWTDDSRPSSYEKPYMFLKNFPPDEARICLRAGEFPIPDWAQPNVLDRLKKDILFLNELNGETRKRFVEEIKRMLSDV